MLNLKLHIFHHLMRITDSLEKTLMLGKIVGGGEGDPDAAVHWVAELDTTE